MVRWNGFEGVALDVVGYNESSNLVLEPIMSSYWNRHTVRPAHSLVVSYYNCDNSQYHCRKAKDNGNCIGDGNYSASGGVQS
jgi:hypothetical protein